MRLLPVLLQRTSEAVLACFRTQLADHGLSAAQYRVLSVLFNSGETGAAEIMRRAFLLGPSLSRIVRDLQHRRLIVRHGTADDARRSFYVLTRDGSKLVETVQFSFEPVFEAVEQMLGMTTIAQLNATLRRAGKGLGVEIDMSRDQLNLSAPCISERHRRARRKPATVPRDRSSGVSGG